MPNKPGPGRPPRTDNRESFLIRITGTAQEKAAMLRLSPDERREALLEAGKEKEE